MVPGYRVRTRASSAVVAPIRHTRRVWRPCMRRATFESCWNLASTTLLQTIKGQRLTILSPPHLAGGRRVGIIHTTNNNSSCWTVEGGNFVREASFITCFRFSWLSPEVQRARAFNLDFVFSSRIYFAPTPQREEVVGGKYSTLVHVRSLHKVVGCSIILPFTSKV